jgi:hypothetical protein
MSSYRSTHQTETPGAARSGRRKHILPTSIIGLILIISAISAIVLQPQQASASTRVHNDVDCSASAVRVTATCTGNIIVKPCSANNVIHLLVDTGSNEWHWICYGGALTSQETGGYNGGSVTFNPAIQVTKVHPSGWSGYLTTPGGPSWTIPFYNGTPLNDNAVAIYTVTGIVISDDSR